MKPTLTLTKDIPAMQLHGKTKRELCQTTLTQGTTYTIVKSYHDILGFPWLRINVDGYLYEIEGEGKPQ